MKGKIIAIGILSLLTQVAVANITITASGPHLGDACGQLGGQWEGKGTVKAGIIVCHYRGHADVNEPAGQNTFNMDVLLNKETGICPEHVNIQLPGDCTNGQIHLNTPDADLHGNLNAAGNEIDLAGKVTFTVLGSPVIADVSDMHIQKK